MTAFRGYQVVHRSDCSAALAVAASGSGASVCAAASALRSILAFSCVTAKSRPLFEHIPGHAGFFSNEIADAAAKLAARGVEVGHLPWMPTSPDDFDWWAEDHRHLEWAGIVCRARLGCQDMPPSLRCKLPRPKVALETVRVPPAKDPACLDLRLASYNVLSLNGAAFADGHSEGLAFAAGRPALLAKNLAQQEVGVAFIQEARTQEGFVRTQDYLRFCSGCEKGHLGVEIWLRDALPIMRRGHDTVVRLSRDACSVLLSDPRRLALHFQQGNFRLRMLSLHAPHRGHPEDAIRAWWHETTRLCAQLATGAPLLLGGDFNACLGSVVDDHISDAGAEVVDTPGNFLQELCRRIDIWLPATWSEHQVGEGWTYFQKRNNAATRPDFIAIPCAWQCAHVRASVDASIHAGQACFDHLASIVCVQAIFSDVQGQPSRHGRRFDISALRSADNAGRLQKVIDSVPIIPWEVSADSHAAIVVKHLQAGLEKEFPAPSRAPRRTYLSETAWQLHQHEAFPQTSVRAS